MNDSNDTRVELTAAGTYLGEVLEPVASDLFRAVREERLPPFAAAHPELAGRYLT